MTYQIKKVNFFLFTMFLFASLGVYQFSPSTKALQSVLISLFLFSFLNLYFLFSYLKSYQMNQSLNKNRNQQIHQQQKYLKKRLDDIYLEKLHFMQLAKTSQNELRLSQNLNMLNHNGNKPIKG